MRLATLTTLTLTALALGGTAVATAAPAQSDVYYATCSEARAAGAAPIHRGEPGYRGQLDRDNDGIACE